MSAKELWRSKTMVLTEIVLKRDSSFQALENVIPLKSLHFIDSQPDVPPFQRPFTNNVVKVAELETKYNYLRNAIEISAIEIPQPQPFTDHSILSLEEVIDKAIVELKSLQADLVQAEQKRENVAEQLKVIQNASKVNATSISIDHVNQKDALISDAEQMEDGLMNLLFVIPKKTFIPCMRGLFRAAFGVLHFESTELSDLAEEKELVSAFIAGQEAVRRCTRIVQSMGGRVYELPQNIVQAENDTKSQLNTYDTSLYYSKQRVNAILTKNAVYIDHWNEIIQTNKIINHTLNMFTIDNSYMRVTAYVPEERFDLVKQHIEGQFQGMQQLGSSIRIIPKESYTPEQLKTQPPTQFNTNKYTHVFQNIVNSYGIPCYKEINPAFFYLYQFPFTFSIMFGDIGHGIINALISMLMLIFEKRLLKVRNDMFELIFMGRYIIFMMSLYSIISGFMYNDIFALGFNMFNTKYNVYQSPMTHTGPNPTYNFGIDPAWHWAGNSMIFLNSYKMKVSIVIGISQMLFGLIIKCVNLVNQKKYIDIFLVWIPEFFFMFSFFGYMVFCIIFKWFVNWPGTPDNTRSPTVNEPAPPALINMLIQIFLSPGSIDPSNQLFSDIDFQTNLQLGIFAVAVLMVVWLAVAEPVHKIIHKKRHPDPNDDSGVGDIIVQQVIHTIEYVLGTISHTASYLRLWALSLAHAQLAEVFFDQLIGLTMGMVKPGDTGSYIIAGLSTIISYGGWFGASIGVLCLMEYLSAFLHCLRLAWIEFNSKFFVAEGYSFEGFGIECGWPIDVTAQMARVD
ncbi:V-type proton ATPase subunit a [Spironucleus salmonicida]|uniref:V-type proton ATPase subunit a n=1 Tax=Spironucleus salmonicida TaxID=348837 RepID=V6LGS4_9EUKA|nr:V-type proton ATPase subunit a [Spironucleus salmonicida]|eukprot:EST43707.1 Vacuolar proton-ATPase subunit [Spironucleus salmonicida]